MENTGRKSEVMKPIMLKAGVPLAVSLAGFIYALIKTRRKLHTSNRASSEGERSRNENESQEEFGEGFVENTQTIQYRPHLEDEILRGLIYKLRALQERERDLEMRFLCYCSLKEYELAFIKLQNILVSEQVRVEFLLSKVESMEAENRRFELMVVEYLRVLKKLETTRLEYESLLKKSKKLLRSARKYSKIASRQTLLLIAREAKISSNHEELQGKAQVIDHLKDEIMALKSLVGRLQDEKKERGEISASSTLMTETGVDDHGQLVTELEKLQEHEEEETGESSELKEEKHEDIQRYNSDASSSTITNHGESCAFIMTTSHKKPKLLQKLRRWVKGSEACRSSWSGKEVKGKYRRIRSVSDRGAEQNVKMRKSCSSA